jgi:hypothetical protein
MGLDGSTGLFVNPSPQNLPSGHLRIGTFNASNMERGNATGSLPLAFSLGFSKQIEASGSLSAWPYSLEGNDQLLSLGAKINIIDSEGAGFSIDARSQNWERAINDTGSLRESVMTGRLIGAFPVRKAVVHVNLGYAQREKISEDGPAVEYPAGIGVVRSFSDRLQTLAEYQTDNVADPAGSSRWTVGIKWYLVDHLQLAAGVLGIQQHRRKTGGFFFNLAFSTASLKAFFRSIASWELITFPSLEELDSAAADVDSTSSPIETLPVVPETGSMPDPELAYLPVPPPLDNLDSWRPDEAWYTRYIDTADPEAELPSPPSFGDTQSVGPTDSGNVYTEDEIMAPSPGNDDLPQPPPLDAIDQPDNKQRN